MYFTTSCTLLCKIQEVLLILGFFCKFFYDSLYLCFSIYLIVNLYYLFTCLSLFFYLFFSFFGNICYYFTILPHITYIDNTNTLIHSQQGGVYVLNSPPCDTAEKVDVEKQPKETDQKLNIDYKSIYPRYNCEEKIDKNKIYIQNNSDNEELLNDSIYFINTNAILDTKWSVRPALITGHRDGNIGIFRFDDIKLKSKYHQLDTSCLYIHNIYEENKEIIYTSGINGHLNVLNYYYDTNTLESKIKWYTKERYDMWCCTSDSNNNSLIYSGDDNGNLYIWDTRQINEYNAIPIYNNSTLHNASITHISFSPLKSNLFATGSHDNMFRLFDTRNMRNPIDTFQCNSSVWRVMWHPTDSIVLLACMDDGAYILRTDTSISVVLSKLFESNDLVYGCTWYNSRPLTASFYSSSLRLWPLLT